MEWGRGFFIENPRRGGGSLRREVGGGAWRVSVGNFWRGGESFFFFFGAKIPTKSLATWRGAEHPTLKKKEKS